jgi:hypothetical protein
MRTKKWLWYGGAVLSLIAAFTFFQWSIQTAWLGSFPGRDVQLYSRWFGMQLGACLFFLIVALVALIKGRRISKTATDATGNVDV